CGSCAGYSSRLPRWWRRCSIGDACRLGKNLLAPVLALREVVSGGLPLVTSSGPNPKSAPTAGTAHRPAEARPVARGHRLAAPSPTHLGPAPDRKRSAVRTFAGHFRPFIRQERGAVQQVTRPRSPVRSSHL